MPVEDSLGEFVRMLRVSNRRVHLRVGMRGNREVGMSREEVATQAGLSVSYLEKIEQGRKSSISQNSLANLMSALGANDDQRQYAYLLAGVPTVPQAATSPQENRPDAIGRDYVDSLVPHLAGYVDLAWNVLYANSEYKRIFSGIEETGNVLVWLLEDKVAKEVMLDWEEEAQLTVSWARSLVVLHGMKKQYQGVMQRLDQNEDFNRMWNIQDPAIGRPAPFQRIRDLDSGEKFSLHVELWSPPQISAGLQMYLGVRRPL